MLHKIQLKQEPFDKIKNDTKQLNFVCMMKNVSR